MIRILLKGAAHYLYSDEDRVSISRVVSDGHTMHRSFDENRLIWQLAFDELDGRTALRDYVEISPGASIQHLPSDHRKYSPDTGRRIDANLLQYADLLLGGVVRTCLTGECRGEHHPQPRDSVEAKKDHVAFPVRELLEKTKRGSGFRNSGHYRSFSVSKISLNSDVLNFERLPPRKFQPQDRGLPFSDEPPRRE